MKNRLIGLIATAFLLSSCGMESIFNGDDKESLSPIEASIALGSEYENFFISNAFDHLGPSVLSDFIKENNINLEVGDYAVVINDSHLLKDYMIKDGPTYKWPDIDFSKYSLVIGRWSDPGTPWYVKEQRVKTDLFGNPVIYLHFVKHGGMSPAMPRLIYFGSIYPKLQSGPAKVVRWEEDVIVPPPSQKK